MCTSAYAIKGWSAAETFTFVKDYVTEQPIRNAILVHFARYHIQIYSHYAITSTHETL